MKKQNFSLRDVIFLSVIILTALVFRLYRINTPLADLHSWRQADTASVSRNFIKFGFDLLHPRYDDLSSIESGKENPEGYRFVEFPLYNAIPTLLYKIYPNIPIEIYGRLTSILFSLITLTLIYYFVFKEADRLAAIIAVLVFATFPFFVFFSRMVLPETMAVTLIFLSIFSLYVLPKDKEENIKRGLLFSFGIFFFALALLVKPTAIFYSPTLLYLFYKHYGLRALRKIWFYLFFTLSIVPFLLWRLYIRNFPEGVPANLWLITSVNTYEGLKNIFFRPAFFRWIFFERLNNMILGGYLSIFFLLGIVRKYQRLFFHSLLVSALIYLFTFQGGNIQHEYYQVIILPVVAIFIGLGVDFLWNLKKQLISQYITIPITVIIFALSFFFSFYRVKDFYNYPQDLVNISRIIKSLTKENDKIITDTLGDTTLLYLSERRGSPAPYKEFAEFKKDDYRYFVTINPDVIKGILEQRKLELVFRNDKFALFRL